MAGRRSRGQATLETGITFGLLCLCLLAVIEASLWGLANMATTAAAEAGVRVAVEARGSATSDLPATEAVYGAVSSQLKGALFATAVVAWPNPPGATNCPSAAEVRARFRSGPTVVVCAVSSPATGFVTVRVVGHTAGIVPLAFAGGGIAIDVSAQGHVLTFAA